MELEILHKCDNYLACKLIIHQNYIGKSPLNYINNDVMFEINTSHGIGNEILDSYSQRCIMCYSDDDSSKNIQINVQFSRKSKTNNTIFVKVKSIFLKLIKTYAVNKQNESLIHCLDDTKIISSLSLDLTFEIEPCVACVGKPICFAPLYEDTALIDFKLQGDDGSVPIHGTALAASSPAFHRMLEGKWTETQERVLKIPQTSKETLQHLKDYIYLGIIPETGLDSLLVLASCYMMNDLQEICKTKLIATLKPDNAIALSKFALNNNFDELFLGVLECVQNGSLKVSDINITKHSLVSDITS